MTEYVAGNATASLKKWTNSDVEAMLLTTANKTSRILHTVVMKTWNTPVMSGGPPAGSNKVTGSFTFSVGDGECKNVENTKFLDSLAAQVKEKSGLLTVNDDQITCKAGPCTRRLAEDRRLAKSAKVTYEIKDLSSTQANSANKALKALTVPAITDMIKAAATEAKVAVTATGVTVKAPTLTSGSSSFAAIVGLSMGSFLAVVGNTL